MSRFFSGRFETLEAYTPGEQPRDMQYIKLNTNESPFPPSPAVIGRINALEASHLNLYPDPQATRLTRCIAEFYGVEPSNVFVSNGSDEILSFSFMAFCDGNRGMAFPDITYGFYKVYGELYGIKCRKIPLCDDFSVNVDDYCGIDENIVIANPNAPTGMALGLDEIERILRSNPDRLVIIDEAYVDFGAESCVPLISEYDNLLVVRTYSKSRSMAGARLGFAIASEQIIADLNTIKYSTNPYNINRLSMAAGEAVFEDSGYYVSMCEEIIRTREYTADKLKQLGFEVLSSSANFLFARHDAISGEDVYRQLKEMGILVRHFSDARIKDYNRISIGTRQQMDALLNAITIILQSTRGEK